jgi:hypothetical protein
MLALPILVGELAKSQERAPLTIRGARASLLALAGILPASPHLLGDLAS